MSASRLARLRDALHERTGYRDLWARLRNVSFSGPPRWAHVPGTLLLGLVVLQVITGITMAFYYAPGTATSWGSVFYLEEQVLLGSFVRGLHAFGASALVICLALHLLQAGLLRAYRKPREVTWLLGLSLIPVVSGFALTGYLLPWDQKGYWATQVATGIMRATPLGGALVAEVFQGGVEMGTLTLTRFYALHTLVLPLALGGLLALHLGSLSRHGPSAPADTSLRTPYWPRQAFRDLLLIALVMSSVAFLAATVGAGLDAPADPSSDYPPRPEWYFAPLRQLLKFVPEPWGSVVLPGLLGLGLAALPWLDRKAKPRPLLARSILALPLVLALLLGLQAHFDDLTNEEFQAARVEALADGQLARQLARDGIPGEGAGELLWRYPPRHGERLFALHCQECHQVEGRGGEKAPNLTGYLSMDWLMGVVREPASPQFFGHTELRSMDPLPRENWSQLRPLASFLIAQDPARRAALDPAQVTLGEEAYYDLECNACHELKPEEPGLGPNLFGYGSDPWLLGFLRDPGHELYYAEDNDMPAYSDKLSEEELLALVAYLRTLATPSAGN